MDGSMRIAVRVPSYALTLDKKLMRGILRKAGAEVAAVARASIKGSARGGRLYYGPGGSAGPYRGGYTPGRYTASTPGSSPARVTGNLERKIKVLPFKSGDGVAVRDTAFYALFLQAGAKGGGGNRSAGNLLPAGGKFRGGKIRGAARLKASAISKTRVLVPRPFLTSALQARESSIAGRIQAAVVDGVEFKRIRA